MGNNERDEEEALFVRKKDPPRDRETKEWTRGDKHFPKSSSEEEDQSELIERRKRCECFNGGKKGHLARDCWSPRRHSEGNVATANDEALSECPNEEEWNAACITIEDDEVYFVEDLIASDTPSLGDNDEED